MQSHSRQGETEERTMPSEKEEFKLTGDVSRSNTLGRLKKKN